MNIHIHLHLDLATLLQGVTAEHDTAIHVHADTAKPAAEPEALPADTVEAVTEASRGTDMPAPAEDMPEAAAPFADEPAALPDDPAACKREKKRLQMQRYRAKVKEKKAAATAAREAAAALQEAKAAAASPWEALPAQSTAENQPSDARPDTNTPMRTQPTTWAAWKLQMASDEVCRAAGHAAKTNPQLRPGTPEYAAYLEQVPAEHRELVADHIRKSAATLA